MREMASDSFFSPFMYCALVPRFGLCIIKRARMIDNNFAMGEPVEAVLVQDSVALLSTFWRSTGCGGGFCMCCKARHEPAYPMIRMAYSKLLMSMIWSVAEVLNFIVFWCMWSGHLW